MYQVSQRRACEVTRIPVSTFRYQSTQEPMFSTSAADSGDRASPNSQRLSEDTVRLKRESWNVGKKLVYRLDCEEGLGAALQAANAERRCGQPPRTRQIHRPELCVELGFRRGSASGWTMVSRIDNRRHMYQGKSGHRSGAKLEGNRCSVRLEPSPPEATHSESTFLREWIGIHQRRDGGGESRPTTHTWNRSTGLFDRSARTPIGSQHWQRRDR